MNMCGAPTVTQAFGRQRQERCISAQWFKANMSY